MPKHVAPTNSPTTGQVPQYNGSNVVWATPSGSVSAATLTASGILKQTVFNVVDYGAKIDGQRNTTVTSTSGSPNVSVSSGNFTSADIGKVAVIFSSSAAGTITTIQSVTDSTHIVLTSNAGITLTSTGYMIYGTDDSAAIQAAIAAAATHATAGTDVTNANQPIGTGFARVVVPGMGPASYSLFGTQLNLPLGVDLDAEATLVNVLASRWQYCMTIQPYARVERLQIENLHGTGVFAGTAAQNSHIVFRELRIWHCDTSPLIPTTVVATPSTTGGTLAASTYFYKVVGIDSTGAASGVSAEVSATTTGTTSSVGLTWDVMPGAVSYRVYAGTRTNAEFHYIASATNSATDIGSGFTVANPAGLAGTALYLAGSHHEIAQLYIKTAREGVYHNDGSDFACSYAYIVGAINPIRTNAANQIRYTSVFFDTCGGNGSLGGFLVENASRNVHAKIQAFGGTSATLSPVASTGLLSSNVNRFIEFDIMANNQGGTVLNVGRSEDFRASINGSNTVFSSGQNLPFTTGVVYGSTLTGAIEVRAMLSSGITPSTGTVVGVYEYTQGGVRKVVNASGTVTLPSTTDTLVGKNTTDIFTNKDFTGAGNTFPTFNQNTTGTAANLSGTPALPSGTTATTQSVGDNSTNLATTAYVDRDSVSPALIKFRDDFTNGTSATVTTATSIQLGEVLWAAAQISAGSQSVANTTGSFGNPGQSLFTTSAVSGQGLSVYRGSSAKAPYGAIGSNAGWEANFVIKMGATSTIAMRAGFCVEGQQVSDSPTNGIYVEYDTNNTGNTDTKFTWVTRSSSTSTYGVTNAVNADNSFHHFRIRSITAGTILFSVDGGVEYSTTSNIPTGNMMLFMQIITRTAGAQTLTADFVSYLANTGRL
jgi:hypothetical protein